MTSDKQTADFWKQNIKQFW